MRWFKKKKDMRGFPKIERTMKIAGRFVPGIIHNSSYFLVDLEVFEDGLIDCWEMVDLEIFEKKVQSGWVCPAVPEGEIISIHHLGAWKIESANWIFNTQNYTEHLRNIIGELNPKFHNIHNCHGRTEKKFGKSRVSILGMAKGKPIRKENPNDYFSSTHKGESFRAFLKLSTTEYNLISVNIFSDGVIQLAGIPEPITLNITGFQDYINRDQITSDIPLHATVNIHGLGRCVFGECTYVVDISEKAKEVRDIIAKLCGDKTTSDICYEIYQSFQQDPSNENRVMLKKAYESVPDHLRIYILGDMDDRDIPIIEIIYK